MINDELKIIKYTESGYTIFWERPTLLEKILGINLRISIHIEIFKKPKYLILKEVFYDKR